MIIIQIILAAWMATSASASELTRDGFRIVSSTSIPYQRSMFIPTPAQLDGYGSTVEITPEEIHVGKYTVTFSLMRDYKNGKPGWYVFQLAEGGKALPLIETGDVEVSLIIFKYNTLPTY